MMDKFVESYKTGFMNEYSEKLHEYKTKDPEGKKIMPDILNKFSTFLSNELDDVIIMAETLHTKLQSCQDENGEVIDELKYLHLIDSILTATVNRVKYRSKIMATEFARSYNETYVDEDGVQRERMKKYALNRKPPLKYVDATLFAVLIHLLNIDHPYLI